ncbi:unnamed protein product [Meloidogyne enterolobii]|uniref:Uncharacterized protein n=1 Tax=Meloidogyne enterolobii TaxID=390850 RepID=A0ACB0Y2B6_MELEN
MFTDWGKMENSGSDQPAVKALLFLFSFIFPLKLYSEMTKYIQLGFSFSIASFHHYLTFFFFVFIVYLLH